MAKTIFGGVGDLKKLPGASKPGPNGEVTEIGKFFAEGKYLLKSTAKGAVDAIIDPLAAKGAELTVCLPFRRRKQPKRSLTRTKQRHRLINAALKAQRYYIWVDVSLALLSKLPS
jgi:hypothetical protein